MRQGAERRVTGRGPGVSLSTGLAIVATLAVAVALLVAVLIVPLVALGQSGPLRDQSQAEQAGPADPTPTARMFQAEAAGDNREPSILPGNSTRPRPQTNQTDAQPSQRPRPDPAPIVLVPTIAVTPEPAPAPEPARARAAAPRPALSRVWPVASGTFEVSQPFGCVPQLLGYYPVVAGCPATAPSYHTGLDLAARQGTPIYAAASGWVTVAGRDRASGVANTRIVIQHDGANDGYITEYYHWIRTYVEPGDYVRAGDLIAEVGSVGYSTGPHLHFTVVDSRTSQQIDPARWLPGSSSSVASAGAASTQDSDAGSDPSFSAGGSIVVVDYIELDPTPTPTPST